MAVGRIAVGAFVTRYDWLAHRPELAAVLPITGQAYGLRHAAIMLRAADVAMLFFVVLVLEPCPASVMSIAVGTTQRVCDFVSATQAESGLRESGLSLGTN